MDAVTLTVVM